MDEQNHLQLPQLYLVQVQEKVANSLSSQILPLRVYTLNGHQQILTILHHLSFMTLAVS